MNRPPHHWLPTLVGLLETEPAVVRVVIAEARGSVPREPGAFMIVSHAGVEGTVGGGRLEWECIAAARDLLGLASASAWRPDATAVVTKIVLAADVGQCCGGVVSVWLDRFTRDDLALLAVARDAAGRGPAVLSSTIKGALVERELICGGGAGSERLARHGDVVRGGDAGVADGAGASARVGVSPLEAAAELLRTRRLLACPRTVRVAAGQVTFLERLDDARPALWLYGAGHVGQALARIAVELPLRLTWVDSRAELFPTALSEDVRVRDDADSAATLADAPVGAYFLVMTHSHQLDYELCRAVLQRNDFAWLGLIGSESKAARFRSRLAREGIPADRIARLVCPIGVPGIESKWPAAIAVGAAAQLMQEMSAAASGESVLVRPQGSAARPIANAAQTSEGSLPAGANVARALEGSLPAGTNVARASKGSLPAGTSASRMWDRESSGMPGLDDEVLPPGDCGEESCSSCGARRRPLG